MAVNRYFSKNNFGEQQVLQNLVTESIKILGHDVYYLPRKLQKLDLILGEDVLSKFDLAIPIEMYMMNERGEQDILSKFGLQVKEQLTYYISKERWIQEIKAPHKERLYNSIRPQEGDLIFDPLSTTLFEITYVDKEDPYYQFGSNWYFKLTCEVFAYSNEEINTGIPEIDQVEDEISQNILNFQLLLEDGSLLLLESGSSIIIDYDRSPIAPEFDKSVPFNSAKTAIEWSVDNPFGEIGD